MTAFDGHKVLHTCDQLVAWLECLFSIRFEIQEEGYSRNWRKGTEIETNRNHISTKMGMVSAGARGTTGKYLPQINKDRRRS
jgi:hypothetical protein